MKKIVSLGVASAVLALTAVAASAATSEKSVKAVYVDGEFKTGATVTYNIVAAGEGVENAQLYFETKGLEFVNAEGKSNFMAQANADEAFLALASGTAAEDGAVIATVTYKVTAEEGEEISFALKADESYPDVTVDETAVTQTVAGAADSTPDDNSDESGDNSDSDSTDPSNPNSGIALAVVPAVIAGAAVVVAAKKRK